jgi:hypothetical protein
MRRVYKSSASGVYLEMKNRLAVFFVGFGTGVAAAFLLIGLAPDRPRSTRQASSSFVIYSDTNAAMAWTQKQSSVRWQNREP